VIQGEGFTIDESKFDFFFGRVTSGADNTRRSRDNLEGLQELGISESAGGRSRLMQIFQSGLQAPIIDTIEKRYGTTIVRKVEVAAGRGAIAVSYFYPDGDLNSIPRITSLIPIIYPQE